MALQDLPTEDQVHCVSLTKEVASIRADLRNPDKNVSEEQMELWEEEVRSIRQEISRLFKRTA